VIPDIDIWRAAQLMLMRFGDKAVEESAALADELAANNDFHGEATSRRITEAVSQLANMMPASPLH
jgi:hypothetical protein